MINLTTSLAVEIKEHFSSQTSFKVVYCAQIVPVHNKRPFSSQNCSNYRGTKSKLFIFTAQSILRRQEAKSKHFFANYTYEWKGHLKPITQ